MTTQTTPLTWAIMPVLAGPAMTEAAIADVLGQSVPVRLLVINQGVDDAFRDRLERLAEQDDRIWLWSHQPSLPSLSATWNRALDCAWACGAEEAFVVNNDVRLHARTIEILQAVRIWEKALFVSCVGVREPDFDASRVYDLNEWLAGTLVQDLPKGGPDFSCFLISRACHERFRFDEAFIPAHCEDLDYHRRLMLAGEGQRIFSINLPYLHLAAQTIAQAPPAVADRIRRETQTIARVHYERCWGGPVNHERFAVKSDPRSAQDGVTTPELQTRVMAGRPVLGSDPPVAPIPAVATSSVGDNRRPSRRGRHTTLQGRTKRAQRHR